VKWITFVASSCGIFARFLGGDFNAYHSDFSRLVVPALLRLLERDGSGAAGGPGSATARGGCTTAAHARGI